MIDLRQRELRVAARNLVRAPLFSLLVVATLALGIGGTTAMFSVANALYLRQLPYPAADRIVALWQTRAESRRIHVSMLDALDWERQNRSFSHLGTFSSDTLNVTQGETPERVKAAWISRGFLGAMGVQPALGRNFTPEEMRNGGAPVVLLSDAAWRRAFHADRRALGRTLRLEGVPFQVVGILPPGFAFPESAQLWLPLSPDDGSARSAHNYSVLARLKPGVALAQAQADLARVGAALARAYPDSDGAYGVAVTPLRSDLLGSSGRALLLLTGAVILVLLIASANVANLLLARALARDPEVTLRAALGAKRRELFLPFLAEGLLLSLAGAGLGIGFAAVARRALGRLAPPSFGTDFPLDGTVLLGALLLSLAVALLVSLAPGLRATRRDLRQELAAGGRGQAGSRRGMNALVAFEVAVTFVLLVVAGLLVRSARRLDEVSPGFRPHRVALASFQLAGFPGSRYSEAGWRGRFYGRLLDEARRIPGVRSAALISDPPLSGLSTNGTLEVPAAAGRVEEITAYYHVTGGDALATLGIPLLQGRALGRDDRENAPRVAVVNQSLAHALAASGPVLGRTVRMPGMDGVKEWATVVGVAGDVRLFGPSREPVPEIYFPYEQRLRRTWAMSVLARSESSPASLARGLRAAARRLEPSLPCEISSLDQRVAGEREPARFRALLLASFAGSALLLAALGLYGLVSYGVGQRVREVGVRLALGSSRGQIERLILRQGLAPVVLGIGVGVAGALALARLFRSLVFAVETHDPASLAAAAAILLLTAAGAAYIPAQRATAIEPIEALRRE